MKNPRPVKNDFSNHAYLSSGMPFRPHRFVFEGPRSDDSVSLVVPVLRNVSDARDTGILIQNVNDVADKSW